MTGLDTNVLVRLVVRDDPDQVVRAAERVRTTACWVATTVLLETEWVLRAVYDYTRDQVLEAFERLLSMENLTLQDGAGASLALEWHRLGLDFADALHLASSRECDGLASFDAPLRKATRKLGLKPVVIEP